VALETADSEATASLESAPQQAPQDAVEIAPEAAQLDAENVEAPLTTWFDIALPDETVAQPPDEIAKGIATPADVLELRMEDAVEDIVDHPGEPDPAIVDLVADANATSPDAQPHAEDIAANVEPVSVEGDGQSVKAAETIGPSDGEIVS